ncbi:MAG TPA: sigma-70 family RNA polymerase sigma factor [Nitriliruptorales bacterium]|nr:sigma-70 family RNA polymerase sigma factor [Nitriliruptorales bacterium]
MPRRDSTTLVLAAADVGASRGERMTATVERPPAASGHTADRASPGEVTSDLVRMYLDDAGRFELLTAEEEADLIKRHRAGRVAEELLRSGAPLPRPRRAVLRRLVRDGRRARERMIAANLRLVVATVRRHHPGNVDLLDLIQEGNLGLMRAVDKFDPGRGYKFSTYASWWIRQAIQRGTVMQARTVRVPQHVWDERRDLRNAKRRFQQLEGCDPTPEELAGILGWSEERVHEVLRAFHDVASLDAAVGQDGSSALGDFVTDDDEDPEDQVVDAMLPDAVQQLLEPLDTTAREVVRLRYGLDGSPPRTLQDIGERMGMSGERVRQIERATLRRLEPEAVRAGILPSRQPDPLRGWTLPSSARRRDGAPHATHHHRGVGRERPAVSAHSRGG